MYKKASFYDQSLEKTIYLYSFMDFDLRAREMELWSDSHRELDSFEFGREFENKFPEFGTIVLQSDLDLKPWQAYFFYKGCAKIALLMRLYRQALMAQHSKNRSAHAALGLEFVHFLALCIEERLQTYLIKQGVLDKESYEDLLESLKEVELEKLPEQKDWKLKALDPKQKALLQALTLWPHLPIKKPGPLRSRKNLVNKKAGKKARTLQSKARR